MKYLFFLILLSFVFLGVFSPPIARAASGTITGSSAYAWGENIGWLNFKADNSNITISDSNLSGYIWSSNYGWINLAPTNGGVTNTCAGSLGGNAWSATQGWISFSGGTINSDGKFTGTIGTLGSTAGRINLDCSNCGVYTDWRPSCLPTPTPTSSPTSNTTTTPTASPTSTLSYLSNADNDGILDNTDRPDQLLDIKLELVKSALSKAGDLSIRIRFESIGKMPTLVDLTYAILDSKGKKVWHQKNNVTVETKKVILKDFKDLQLADGKYTFVLTTLYNTSVKDEFKQTFTVGGNIFQKSVVAISNLWQNNRLFAIISIIFFALFLKKIFPRHHNQTKK